MIVIGKERVPVEVLFLESVDQLLLLETFEALRIASVYQGLHLKLEATDGFLAVGDDHVDILGQVLLALLNIETEGLLTERHLLATFVLHVTVAMGLLVLGFVVDSQLRIDQV